MAMPAAHQSQSCASFNEAVGVLASSATTTEKKQPIVRKVFTNSVLLSNSKFNSYNFSCIDLYQPIYRLQVCINWINISTAL